jgi:GT2 family glycosyltransferase
MMFIHEDLGKVSILMKADLVMWAKNGANTLPTVLKRADEVLPHEAIDKKIFVDDGSTDESREIAKDFGWTVYENEKGGVGSGANTGFHHVEHEYFISLEQDLVLARDWFDRVPRHLEKKNVAVAQGWRLPDQPVLREIDEFAFEKSKFTLNSIDNTIYRSKIVRSLGGFPEDIKYGAVDTHLRLRIENLGLKWIIDPTVVSIHLRTGGLREQIKRHYLYGLYAPPEEGQFIAETKTRRAIRIAMTSPLRALEIAVKKRCPRAIYYYPLMRFSFMIGTLKR